jgi:small subunit ribosomal protein S6
MRKYEIIFILQPDTPEDAVERLISQMEGVVTTAGGKIEKVDRMGRRRLAYHVGRHREGLYVLFVLEGSGDTVREFERRLRVTDYVIKFLTVRTDEELKRTDKLKAIRAKQQARKPRPKPGAPATQPAPEAQPSAT